MLWMVGFLAWVALALVAAPLVGRVLGRAGRVPEPIRVPTLLLPAPRQPAHTR